MGDHRARQPRFNETPRYRAAFNAHDAAMKTLRDARVAMDEDAIACAEKLVSDTAATLDGLNLERFEVVASKQTAAALKNVDELMKLANSRRYPITTQHARAIVDALQAGVNDLKATLAAALARPGQRRPLIFANGEDHAAAG